MRKTLTIYYLVELFTHLSDQEQESIISEIISILSKR